MERKQKHRNARDTLRHILSLRIPATAFQEAAHLLVPETYPWPGPEEGNRKIGFGQCGLVYAVSSEPGAVVKIARPHFGDSLRADYVAHERVSKIFSAREWTSDLHDISRIYKDRGAIHAKLPKVIRLEINDSAATLGRFVRQKAQLKLHEPEVKLGEDNSPGRTVMANALYTSHIPPLSKPVRDALIELYCPVEKRDSVHADPTNVDCLVRVYLGRRRRIGAPAPPNFALRNYNLHLDQMVDLGLPVVRYAAAMGEALADMHWGANVDAFDVEFVLGGPAADIDTASSRSRVKVADLWLLDFNLCSVFVVEKVYEMEGLEELVDHLVYAFFANDPYYPHPSRDDGSGGRVGVVNVELLVWNAFKEEYLWRSMEIFRSQSRVARSRYGNLPAAFLDGCMEKQRGLDPGVDKITD
ncbi:hypothetical protein B0T22DRAFT_378846 [Podospora appendiculata]|uniref:DUF3669 domain-containing protein n=1 Tax=Podospora appendiculata TaxID=314037 RepID=A0AAE1CDT9_9PEZI|nr:hypothetical protein B0T22DRAFT_378846 [Podospora appendiculata]